MKRWRPPRPLILIALLLLMGAVVNVLVSLALAAQGGGALRDREEFVRQWSVVHEAESAYNRRRPAPYKPTVELEQDSVKANDFGLRMSLIGRRNDCALTIDTGWPARALRYTATYAEGVRQSSGVRWPVNNGRFAASCGGIPTTPLPGFAVNTLFYAASVGAIFAVPLSASPIRRRLRARRGRCPKCGYDLAGLAGADPDATCPECGAAR